MGSSVHWNIFRILPAEISEIRPAIRIRIAVENFCPSSNMGNTDAIFVARNRREVTNHQDGIGSTDGLSDKAQHALLRIAAIDPFETFPFTVQFVKSAFVSIGVIQIANPALKLPMRRKIQKVPVQAVVVS